MELRTARRIGPHAIPRTDGDTMLTRTKTGCALALLLALPACTIETPDVPDTKDASEEDEAKGDAKKDGGADAETTDDTQYLDGAVPKPPTGDVAILPAHSRGSAVA